MDDARIGRGVRRLRHRRSWTQEDLAARGGQSQDVVSRVERGRIEDMPLRRVRAIARALDAELVVSEDGADPRALDRDAPNGRH